MAKSTEKTLRVEIPYFDGVNTLVGSNISKKQELSHIENARSVNIGTIEKRKGRRRLGSEITATENFDIFYFKNDGNNGFYRISTVSSVTSIYYLNNSSVWTALTGFGTTIYELGGSTTRFDITNPSGTTFRYTYDGTGTDPKVEHHIGYGTSVVIAAQNFTAANNGTFTVTGTGTNYFDVTNAAGVAENNVTIGTGSIKVDGDKFSHTIAGGRCYLSNGMNNNMYIESDGTTVVDSTTSTGNLYNSPKAKKINYYKNRLYVSDYVLSGARNKSGVQRSSNPLGIASLVNGDHASGVTTLNVTSTKYIYASDSLDVYRGNTSIETLTVTAKTENTITVSATSNALKSSDEIWVADTFGKEKVFRWVDNAPNGIKAKEYDTFDVSGGQDSRIKMMDNINNIMLLGSDDNLTVWNEYNLENFDLGIGCVSDNGYVKFLGGLWFMDYSGIFMTAGGAPKLMSSKVQKYIDGATKTGLEATAAGKNGYSVFFAIGDVTLYKNDGSTYKTLSDVVLEFNIKQENWYVHTGITATQFETYVSSSGVDRLEFSSTETKYHVFELFNTYEDDGDEIPMRIDSDLITLGRTFEQICVPMQVIVETERGSGIRCFVSLDDGPFYELDGNITKGCTILKVKNRDGQESTPPRCRQIKVSLRDFTKKPSKFSKIAIIYTETSEKEEYRLVGE